jgi:transcriptional regulator of acetoin/glycerol metabolism
LTAGDQARLLVWMEDNRPTRVIARASSPLFPLVQQGAFSAPLYYRLNTVLVAIVTR